MINQVLPKWFWFSRQEKIKFIPDNLTSAAPPTDLGRGLGAMGGGFDFRIGVSRPPGSSCGEPRKF